MPPTDLLSTRSPWQCLDRICPSNTLPEWGFSLTVLITNSIINSITDLVLTSTSWSITLKKNHSVWNWIKCGENIKSFRTNLTPEMNQPHGVKNRRVVYSYDLNNPTFYRDTRLLFPSDMHLFEFLSFFHFKNKKRGLWHE